MPIFLLSPLWCVFGYEYGGVTGIYFLFPSFIIIFMVSFFISEEWKLMRFCIIFVVRFGEKVRKWNVMWKQHQRIRCRDITQNVISLMVRFMDWNRVVRWFSHSHPLSYLLFYHHLYGVILKLRIWWVAAPTDSYHPDFIKCCQLSDVIFECR